MNIYVRIEWKLLMENAVIFCLPKYIVRLKAKKEYITLLLSIAKFFVMGTAEYQYIMYSQKISLMKFVFTVAK